MAKYSKQTYEMVAGIIKQQVDLALVLSDNVEVNGVRYCALNMAESFAIKFAEDNPNFKGDLFMRACGFW